MKKLLIVTILAAGTAQGQGFTTQAEVQPILELTRANWVGLGQASGRDLLYFTHLLSWRCGMAEIRYGLNGAAAENVLQMEPCHRDTNQPNAIRELPFVSYPPGTIESVHVVVHFPDGTQIAEGFTRAEIRID